MPLSLSGGHKHGKAQLTPIIPFSSGPAPVLPRISPQARDAKAVEELTKALMAVSRKDIHHWIRGIYSLTPFRSIPFCAQERGLWGGAASSHLATLD